MTVNIEHKNSELVAKKWAKAVMELALEDESVSKEEILKNLNEIAETINSSDELKNVIANPVISVEEKQNVLSRLFQNQVLPIVYNFLFVLNLKKRVNIISDIAIEFQKELEEFKNILRIDITSAIELNDDRKSELRARIAEYLNKDVIINWGVDADIIAGLIFNINETIIDNSIKNKLEEIQAIACR